MMPRPKAVLARAAVFDFRIPRSWPRLVQAAALTLAAPLGETWEMARRDLRPLGARHVRPDTDRSFFFDAAYGAAGPPL